MAGDDCPAQVVASGPDVAGDPLYETLLSVALHRDAADLGRDALLRPRRDARAGPGAGRAAGRRCLPDRPPPLESSERRPRPHRLPPPDPQRRAAASCSTSRSCSTPRPSSSTTWRIIGSANMDMRSLFLNYEVALFLYGHAQVEETADWARVADDPGARRTPVATLARRAGRERRSPALAPAVGGGTWTRSHDQRPRP